MRMIDDNARILRRAACGRLLAAGIVLAACAATAPAAVVVDFADYADGEVVNQTPTPKFTGTTGQFRVDDTTGGGGGKGLSTTSNAAEFSSVRWAPTDAQQGGTWGSGQKQAYSFDLKLASSSVTGTMFRLYVGAASASVHAIEIAIGGDGDVYVNGNSRVANNLLADGAFHHFYGTIDYADTNGNYTLYTLVNGVETALVTARDFDATNFNAGFTAYGGYQLNIRTSNAVGAATPSSSNSVVLDNLSLHVPEPTSATMAIAAVGLMGLRRQRRR